MDLAKIILSLLLASLLATGCGGEPGVTTGGEPTIRHVDDDAGPTQGYATIQAAVNDAKPGDTVLVHDGNYRGFIVYASGKPSTRKPNSHSQH